MILQQHHARVSVAIHQAIPGHKLRDKYSEGVEGQTLGWHTIYNNKLATCILSN